MPSNRSFDKPPTAVALLKWTRPHVELREKFYVASPPVGGPQACIIEMIPREGQCYLRDAVIVLPATTPHHHLANPPKRIALALGISSTINKKYVNARRLDTTIMAEIPATIDAKPFRTARQISTSRMIKDLIKYDLPEINGKTARDKQRLDFLVTHLQMAYGNLQSERWTPWILNKDAIFNSEEHEDFFILLQDWKIIKEMTWKERWVHLKGDLYRRYKRNGLDDKIDEHVKKFRLYCGRRGLK